jgi:hypothetical protein
VTHIVSRSDFFTLMIIKIEGSLLLLFEVAYRKKHGKVGKQQGLQWELEGLPSSFDGVDVILILGY